MHIRKAAISDVQALSRMNVHVQRMHADAYPALFKQPASEDFAVPFFRSLLHDPEIVMYIAEEEGPLGYVVLRIIHREENAFTYARRHLYIDQICVLPEHQGKGIGKALMSRSEQTAREEGLDFVGLDSWAFNSEAHEFFYSQGYQVYNWRMWKQVEESRLF